MGWNHQPVYYTSTLWTTLTDVFFLRWNLLFFSPNELRWNLSLLVSCFTWISSSTKRWENIGFVAGRNEHIKHIEFPYLFEVVVSNIYICFLMFIPIYGNDPIWLLFFQMGGNYQLVFIYIYRYYNIYISFSSCSQIQFAPSSVPLAPLTTKNMCRTWGIWCFSRGEKDGQSGSRCRFS